MAEKPFVWRDVSEVPGIAARAIQAPAIRRALIDLNFRSVGYIEREMPWISEEDAIVLKDKVLAEPDARALIDSSMQTKVHEIFASPDGRALATVGEHFGDPVVNFRSVSERGWVLDTGSESTHSLRHRKKLTGLLIQFITGGVKHIGTRENSGFFEQHEAIPVSELWELHQQRVGAILKSDAETLRTHDSTAIYAAGGYHTHRIYVSITDSAERFGRIFGSIGRLLTVVLTLTYCIGGMVVCRQDWFLETNLLALILVSTLPLLGLYCGMVFTSWFFHHHVLPRLRGPEPMTLDALLEEVERLRVASGK